MGGFYLKGPLKCFMNKPNTTGRHCRCMGFSGDIDAATEKMLLNKPHKVLVMEELPKSLRSQMEKAHLGPILEYEVRDPPPPLPSAYDSMQTKIEALKRERDMLLAVTA